MNDISRRVFLKTSALLGGTMTFGNLLGSERIKLTEVLSRAEASPGSANVATVVSDVDAHSQCLMQVRVKDGKVIGIQGDPADPESKGELTPRGQKMKEMLYAPDRLRYPLKRTGERGAGQWKRISWDEALATVADRFKEIKRNFGPEAIHFLHGHYHSGDILGSYLPRLANLIGTPNVSNPSHVCHLPRVFLQYQYDFGAVVPPDVPHTKCLILWGGNPAATNKPQDLAIRDARKRGAKLIVVDPRVTPYAREADIHARLRPGTDGALALAMLHVIINEDLYDHEFVEKWTKGFDRLQEHVRDYSPEKMADITWVPAETISRMARMYASTKPSCISPRNALDQHTNASCAIRAIDLLMAITGNLDVKGGNLIVIPISMGIKDLKLYEKLPPEAEKKKIGADKSLYAKISKTWPSAHTPSVWDAVISGNPYPVKAMFVTAANPMLTSANTTLVEKALRSLDFLVVSDLFMTPTAELADIVLPASTFLETTRFVTYDTHADHGWNATSRIALSPRVIEPLWESRPDWKIICDLGRKMGYGSYFPWKDEEEAIDHVIEPLDITCEDLRKHPEGVVIDVPPFLYKKFDGVLGRIMRPILKATVFRGYPDKYRKYEAKGFMTPSKKVEIYSERLEKLGYDPLPVYREPAESPISRPDMAKEYPFILIAGTKLPMYTHSMMHNIPGLHKQFPENFIEIHPEAATRLGIRDGGMVRVSSPRGHIRCRARVTEVIDPRVVQLPHGFKEANCNILTDHRACDPITGSPGLKSSLCKVEAVSG